MKKVSVTKALREVLFDLFAYTHQRQVYSDARKDGAAMGVKFVGLKLTEDEMAQVRRQMEARGFTHHYSRLNAQGWITGTRFCYSPPGVEIVKEPKQELKNEQSGKDMSTPKMYEVHLTDIMKIHDIACDKWKEIIMDNYISKVHRLKLTYTFFQRDVDKMIIASTPSQAQVLEQVFGKQVKEIEWNKIKTGSKVKIKYTRKHYSGWIWDTDSIPEVDVVFFGTEHCIRGGGYFERVMAHTHLFTFHKDGQFILFGANNFGDCKDFVVEVVEY